MNCMICKEPVPEITRKTHLILKDGDKCIKSKEPTPICFDCYALGDYKGLACAVIESAIDDVCNIRLNDIHRYGKYRTSAIAARRMEAKGFLFGKGVELWASVAEIPVDDIRAHVKKRIEEVQSREK